MRFWKHSLLAAGIFMGIASTVTYTSCTHDSCKNLICRNGGTCADEACRCPDGYEGTQCEILSRTKFLGTYDGQIKVNDLPVKIDSAVVITSNALQNNSTIETFIYSRLPEKMTGAVVGDEVNTIAPTGKKISYKMIAANRIEIVIDEMVEGERVITNFQGDKR